MTSTAVFYFFSVVGYVGGFLSFAALLVVNPKLLPWIEVHSGLVIASAFVLNGVLVAAALGKLLLLVYVLMVPAGISLATAYKVIRKPA